VAGTTLRYSVAGSDKEDRHVALSGLHATVTRVVGGVEESTPLLDVTGQRRFTFAVPTDTASLGTDVVYRVRLTATDADGLTDTVTRDLAPAVRTTRLRVALPRGVTLAAPVTGTLNSGTIELPGSLQSIAGVRQSLTAPATIVAGGVTYSLVGYTGSRKGPPGLLEFGTPNATATIVSVYR
jgi:hypothetical protein